MDESIKSMHLQQELEAYRRETVTLRAELEDARETLAAIQSGAVDALVIDAPDGPRIYTLEGAEQVYRNLIESMQDGAVTLNAEGAIDYCNRRFAELLKLPLGKIIGHRLEEWVDAANYPAMTALLAEGADRRELLFDSADGTKTPTLVSIVPLPDSSIQGICLVVTDLTERLRDQTRMAEAEKHLRQAQKLDAVGQLTGGVAHDFNNLLMVISGGLSLLERPGDAERRQRIIAQMRQATEQGASLSRQLLAFARRQPLKPEPIDLKRQIEAMREILDRTLRGDVQIKTEFPEDLWPIKADPTELELVILNLCVNARDAMPQGGIITISAHNAPRMIEGELVGDFVRVIVTDTGIGMSAEVLARIFEPFFTTKDIGKGSGLGLPQVYGFAQQSGGAVKVDSVVGLGTAVTLILPRTDVSPASQAPPAIDFESTGRRRALLGSILLVEDNDEVASLVSEMLRELGYRVTRAASAQAALGALADGREVDLVFSDILMPGSMGGIDLAREIQRRRPGVSILLTTGYGGTAIKDAEAQNIQILCKPYEIEELDAALRTALGKRIIDT
jgi:PAS domain S-box-containing protein